MLFNSASSSSSQQQQDLSFYSPNPHLNSSNFPFEYTHHVQDMSSANYFPHGQNNARSRSPHLPENNQNENESQNAHMAQQPSSQFYLDPTIYFNPSDYSHVPFLPAYDDLIATTSTTVGRKNDVSPDYPQRKARLRASRACIPCRTRHMKCDSVEPVCTRCLSENKQCEYARSRRGGLNHIPVDEPQASALPHQQQQQRSFAAFRSESFNVESQSSVGPSEGDETDLPTTEKLIEKYYEHFAKAHPMILPKKNFLLRMRVNPDSLSLLLPVVEWVGSIYLPRVSSEPYLERARYLLRPATSEATSVDLPQTGFTVQALCMLSFALHCSDKYEESYEYLNRSIDIALSINMHRQAFAEEYGEGDKVLEDSWRRTWWAASGLDALYAGIAFEETHRLKGFPEQVDLPCEEEEYESGQIPPPRTIQEYDEREFCEPGLETVFSSFTYLIDAGRILSSNLAINNNKNMRIKPSESILAAADAKYVNWFLYLPRCKQNLIRGGEVDEIMFMAILLINTQKILLHRPHSLLRYHSIEQMSNCVPPIPSHALSLSLALHTEKCREAFVASITLFALPSHHLNHTPIMSCGLSLAILAQVSACIHTLTQGTDEYIASRDRIKLGLGAMRASMQCWFSTSRSVREVVAVAKELLAIRGGRISVDQNSGLAKSRSILDDGSKDGSIHSSVSDDMMDADDA